MTVETKRNGTPAPIYEGPMGFFRSLSPIEQQLVISTTRPIELAAVSRYGEGYKSPQLRTVENHAASRHYQTQTPGEPSCVYYSSANAFITLDGSDPRYTRGALQQALSRNGMPAAAQGYDEQIRKLTEVDQQYSHFRFTDDPMAENGFERFFNHLAQGQVFLWAGFYDPDLGMTFIQHERAVLGFKIERGSVRLVILDPYEREPKEWSFREIITAVNLWPIKRYPDRMTTYFVNIGTKQFTRVEKRPPIRRVAPPFPPAPTVHRVPPPREI